jgi:hypothetical protein
VAYFFVDAMRFEMGVELSERLPKSVEVSVRPAVCALPSITPIGMAALQPGASSSFSVVEQAGTLGAKNRRRALADHHSIPTGAVKPPWVSQETGALLNPKRHYG